MGAKYGTYRTETTNSYNKNDFHCPECSKKAVTNQKCVNTFMYLYVVKFGDGNVLGYCASDSDVSCL